MDKTLRLWDIGSSKEARIFGDQQNAISSALFSQDGKYIIASIVAENVPPIIKQCEAATGKEIKTFSPNYPQACFAPDGKHAVLYGYTTSTALLDMSSGQVIDRFENKRMSNYRGVLYSADSRYIVTRSHADGISEFWDITSGKFISSFKTSRREIISMAISPDNKYMLVTTLDGITRRLNPFSGKEIARTYMFKAGEWVVITPEGYYDSSANGDKYLNVRIRDNVYGLDQFRATFYKPEVVEAALKLSDSEQAAKTLGQQKIITQAIEPPTVMIKSHSDGDTSLSNQTEISLHIRDSNHAIEEVKLFINGQSIIKSNADGTTDSKSLSIPKGKKTLELKILVVLKPGENIIEVNAFNGFSEEKKTIRIYVAN